MNKILDELKKIEALLLSNKKVFNLEDFCSYTGFSKSHAYKLTSSRKIKFSVPNGKVIFFKKEDVDKYLLSNPTASIDDIEQEAINYVTKKTLRGGGSWN